MVAPARNKIVNKKPPAAGRGRPKGAPNKTTAAVKDMILAALAKKGGAKYLEEQADANPTAFLTLIGKLIPLDVKTDNTVTLVIKQQRDAAVSAALRADT